MCYVNKNTDVDGGGGSGGGFIAVTNLVSMEITHMYYGIISSIVRTLFTAAMRLGSCVLRKRI